MQWSKGEGRERGIEEVKEGERKEGRERRGREGEREGERERRSINLSALPLSTPHRRTFVPGVSV